MRNGVIQNRIVLFGSSGFVGSHIAAALKDCEVTAPEWPAVDVTVPDSLRGIIRPGDIVINAAGYANSTDATPRGRALFRSVNVDGLRSLAEAAADAGSAQFVHISSVAAMGRLEGKDISEDVSGPITSPYAESKRDGERLLAGFAGRMPVTVLRPTSVFGEGRGLVVTLCSLVRRGIVPLPSGGRALIPFTYIGNVVHGVRLALANPACFDRTFIVGDRTSYPLKDIVVELARAMGVQARIVPVPWIAALAVAALFEKVAALTGTPPVLDRFRLDTLTRSVSYSIRAFQEATGYDQPYSFRSSMEAIAEWYRSQRTPANPG